MRFGLFMMPVHPPDRLFADTLDENIEKSLLADRQGFDELWLGEHFSATSEPIPSPLIFMASLLPRTQNLTFGTAVINLPNHDPVVVAAEVAQFDHMSRGRFMLGIGTGGLVSDFELFDAADPTRRGKKLMESIGLIERIWAQDPPYDFPGDFRSVKLINAIVPHLGIGYMPKPNQKPRPPIFISIGSPNSTTTRVAAARGWGMISGNNAPTYSVASHWAGYSKACAEAGRPARGENWRVSRNIMVAASDAQARDQVFATDSSNRYFYTYMREVLGRAGRLNFLKPRPDMPDAEATVEVIMDGCVLYGAPKTVLDKLVAFRDDVGPFGGLLMTGLDWRGRNGVWEQESMRLLGSNVMPKFRQHVMALAAE